MEIVAASPVVYITPEAKSKLEAYLRLAGSDEISGLGAVDTVGGAMLVTEVYLFEQRVSGASTILDMDDVSKWLDEAGKNGVPLEKIKLWFHSHPFCSSAQALNWSGTDDATCNQWENGWMLAILGNGKGHYKCRLDFYDPARFTLDNLAMEIYAPMDEKLLEEMKAEVASKIKKTGGRGPHQGQPFRGGSWNSRGGGWNPTDVDQGYDGYPWRDNTPTAAAQTYELGSKDTEKGKPEEEEEKIKALFNGSKPIGYCAACWSISVGRRWCPSCSKELDPLTYDDYVAMKQVSEEPAIEMGEDPEGAHPCGICADLITEGDVCKACGHDASLEKRIQEKCMTCQGACDDCPFPEDKEAVLAEAAEQAGVTTVDDNIVNVCCGECGTFFPIDLENCPQCGDIG
jgi:hypothetical protein